MFDMSSPILCNFFKVNYDKIPKFYKNWNLKSQKSSVNSAVWYKTKFGSQNLATKFGYHLCMATKIGRQY